MSNAEWDAMSDRERDALVAEKVMGWRRYETQAQNPYPEVPAYTTTPEGMMAVVERMKEQGYHGVNLHWDPTDGGEWLAKLPMGVSNYHASWATTPYEAVAIAALTALGHMEDP